MVAMFLFPTGLGQVLDTYAHIRGGLSTCRAFEAVARRRRVTPPTIRSACTRNLGLTSQDFHMLTRPEHEPHFRRFILSRFPLLAEPIGRFLDGLPPDGQLVADEPAPYGKPGTAPAPRVVKMLTKWSNHPGVPAQIKAEMQILAEEMQEYHHNL
jgi:hypothetical protein